MKCCKGKFNRFKFGNIDIGFGNIRKANDTGKGLRVRFIGNGIITSALDGILRELSADFVSNGTITSALETIKLLDVDFSGYGLISAELDDFDPDYQAVLNYATAQGYTLPSESQILLQNQLVLDLKGDSIWSLLDVFYVYATNGDSDFAKINWKNPNANFASEVNSPTFTIDKGFNGNGSTSYLDTNFSPSTHGSNFTQNDASWFAWAEGANSSGQFWVGQADGRNGVRLATSDAQRINSASNASSSVGVSSTLSKSHVLFSRSDSSNFEIDITDTVTEVNTNYARTATSTTLTTGNFLVGSWFGAYANAQCSFFGTGSNLSSKRASLVSNLKTYFDAL